MERPVDTSAVALVTPVDRPGGVQVISSYKVNRRAESTDLVELAQAVQKADEFTRANAGNKLTVIADQIKYLQEQARKVLQEAKRDADLHHAACNMVKKPGTTYYLYDRKNGQKYLSIVSPEEWGASCPPFHGAFRLEYDQSWTPMEDVERRSQEIALVDKVLNSQLAITDSFTVGLAQAASDTTQS